MNPVIFILSPRCPIEIKQGSHLLHPQHGVGKVQSIRKRQFSGAEAASYAQLYFEREALTLIVLEDDISNTFRRLITATEAQSLLEQISNWEGKPKKQWKARAEAHQHAIESGDPLECAKVLKGLTQVEAQDSLRIQDRDHLKKSMELLTDELARALKKRPAQARKMIIDAVGA